MKALLLAVLIFTPNPGAAQEVPVPEPNWGTPVPPTERKPFALPAVREDALANGIKLSLLELKDLPIVTVVIQIRRIVESIQGEAKMITALLQEGTLFKDVTAFDRARKKLGAFIKFKANSDDIAVSVTAKKDSIRQAVALAAEAIFWPKLADEDLERNRVNALAGIKQNASSPEAMAAKQLNKRIFGDHPYGHSLTEQDINSLDRAKLLNFHAKNFVPSAMGISIAGDIGLEEAKSLAGENFRSRITPEFAKTAQGIASSIPDAPAAAAAESPPEIDLIDRPGMKQSVLMLGLHVIPRNHPDYYPLRVMNAVFGGGMGSRIYQNLRERNQWTYGASSAFQPALKEGALVVQTKVKTENAADAVREILFEMNRLRDEEVPEPELAKIKNAMEGNTANGLAFVQALAGALSFLDLHGIPKAELPKIGERILAVTSADVQRVARIYLQPNKAAIVVAGDAVKIRAALEKIASVRLITPD